jgi:signal transduction histidine kinase/CheY-like chemotaxis protein/streptogramin lyase
MQPRFFNGIISAQGNSYIQDVKQNIKGKVYFTNGNQVFEITNLHHAHSFKTIYTSNNSTILRLAPSGEKLWMADNKGIINVFNTNGNSTSINTGKPGAVFILESDLEGNIWFCQDGSMEVKYITPNEKIISAGFNNKLKSKIISIKTDPVSGVLYLGGTSDDAFLYRYNPYNQQLTNLSKKVFFEHNLPIAVNDIAVDKQNEIWLATTFGLLKYNNKGYERINLGQETENTIKSLDVDSDGNIWVTASTGLLKYKDGEYFSFSERDGLPSKTATYRALLIDQQNQIWVGTIAGLGHSGNNIAAIHTPTPVLWSILKNGKNIELNGISYQFNNKSFVKLFVNVPSYPGNAINYEARIINRHDTLAWTTVTNTIERYLTDYNTGNYIIQIRAKKDGNFSWSKPLSINITITRVWFETWWILLLIIAFIGMTGYFILKYQRIKMIQEQSRLEDIIKERTHEITDQNKQIEDQNAYILSKNKELETTNKELLHAKIKAEQLDKAKSQFLSTMSHELRTPMNAVIGMTYILLNENPLPQQIDNLETLKFSAENLLALINDILDFSKIEAGKITFEEADFDLRDKIHSVLQVIKVKADEKGVHVYSEIDSQIPEYLIGDPTRLNQILFNLAGNAVKFTESGHVKISVDVIKKNKSSCALVFKISDTGIGIAPDKIDTIFDSFTQASLEITRKYGGTGLGLSITKKLIELQGGRIIVDSIINTGTTFTVFLDYKISEKTSQSIEDQLPEFFETFENESVLIVDDNQINLIVAKKFLTKWNLQIDTAENGLIALEQSQRKNYSLILMDLQMPELDGYQTTKRIREREKAEGLTPIPIIALTASALMEVKNNIKAIGMDDFITKPFNPNELNFKISKYLKKPTINL